MKKAISFFLAFIMLISAVSFSFTGFAAGKKYVADELSVIQTKSGFVPGKTAAVVGNCYGFISAVCEKLYGVKYQAELTSDGYTCKHRTGYFYTVKTYITQSSDTAACAKDIMNFFVNNAYPGDIVHYASLNGSSHTFMIQSIDEEKMEIFHSNYQTKTLSSSSCHIDPIIWSSFLKNPTKTEYNADGSLLSHNSIFYNKQKRGGIGITINRYSKYEDKFYPNYSTPKLTASRANCTSIKLKWTPVKGAEKYQVQYKLKSAADFTTLTSAHTSTSYTVKNLTTGKSYSFRVRAFAGGKWHDYSNVETKKVLPPLVTSVVFAPASDGLKLSWTKKTDLTGVRIYRCDTSNGTYSKIAELSGSTDMFLDKNIKYGVTYYYKIQRFLKVGDTEYKTKLSSLKTFPGAYVLKTPAISYERPNATTITFHYYGDGCQDSFDYSIVSDSNKKSAATVSTKNSSLTIENLNVGESYTLSVRERTKIAVSEYGSLTVTAAPRAVTDVASVQKKTGIKVSFTPQNDVDGYIVYRSVNGGNYEKAAQLFDKSKTYYFDKEVSNKSSYQYIVKSFIENGEEVIGDEGIPSAPVKVTLNKPTGLTVTKKGKTSVRVSWNSVSVASRYDLQYKVKGGKWKTVTGIKKAKRVVKGLTKGRKYYFRVRSTSKLGIGNFSKKRSIKVQK